MVIASAIAAAVDPATCLTEGGVGRAALACVRRASREDPKDFRAQFLGATLLWVRSDILWLDERAAVRWNETDIFFPGPGEEKREKRERKKTPWSHSLLILGEFGLIRGS